MNIQMGEVTSEKLTEFRRLIMACGQSGDLFEPFASDTFMYDTILPDIDFRAPLFLSISSSDQLRRALDHARQAGVTIHPVSTGRNWGYGTTRPYCGQINVVLNLSRMKRIQNFDRELGIVRVEPGVTQGQLAQFLDAQDAPFMVPTTGAGPDCSLVGNALERGYGMTPVSDHFQAVLGLEAITGTGRTYRSCLQGKDQFCGYRWGVGPYLDGLFTQSSGAVVTSMTLQLMPRPERTEMFLFWLKSEASLSPIVDEMRGLLTTSGLSIGGINLMNAARIEAMAGPGAAKGCAWVGTGVVYGTHRVVRAGRTVIRQALGPYCRRVGFVNAQRLTLAERALGWGMVPRGLERRLKPLVRSLRQAHDVLNGQPNEFALRLAYRNGAVQFPTHQAPNPAHDGCGLLWYAPIVPMRGEDARRYNRFVTRVCKQYGFSPPITYSTLSPSAFDSTVPLLFARDDENSTRARNCLRALIREGRSEGFHPYRFHVDMMDEATDGNNEFWWMARRIQALLDPDSCIAPGRYNPSPDVDADYREKASVL